MSIHRPWRRVFGLAVTAALVLVVTGMVLAPSPASAHATLVSSDPKDGSVVKTAPDAATFTFDETVSVPADGVQVFDADGQPVEAEASSRDEVLTVDLPGTMPDGTYIITWLVTSADGHAITGSLSFSVGKASDDVVKPEVREPAGAAVTMTLSLLNGLTYIGMFLTLGIAVFWLLLAPRRVHASGALRILRRVATAGMLVSIGAAVIALPYAVISQQALVPADPLLPKAWSGVSATSVVAVVLLAVGLVLVRLALARWRSEARNIWLGVTGVGVLLCAISPSLVGHTRSVTPEVLMIALDVLHVLAGSVWLGGLVALAVTLPAIASERSLAVETLTQFSTVAAGVLGVLVAAGVVLAWRILDSWEALFDTTYGRLLLVKIGIVALAAGIAAWNRWVLLPRTRDARTARDGRVGVVRLGRVVAVEALVLVVVAGLTGFLVNQSPLVTEEESGREVQTASFGDGYEFEATIDPARVGQTTIRVELVDNGEPLELDKKPTIRLLGEVDLGQLQVERQDDGVYMAAASLPAAGSWKLQVGVQLSKFDNRVGTAEFEVSGG